MTVPFWAPPGATFVYCYETGVRELITFVEDLGSDVLHMRRSDGEVFQVPHPETRELVMPTVTWAARAFNDRMLLDPAVCDESLLDGRQARFLDLDRAACMRHDPKCGWRYDWAMLLIGDKVPKAEPHVKKWLKTAAGPGKKPAWRSLLRWVWKLAKANYRIGALVSTAGRLKGESQLSDVEDRIVHMGALWYWARENETASKDDAAAMVVGWWDELDEAGVQGLGENPPSAECVRERINSLENRTTWTSKYGIAKAEKKFGACGEPVPVARPFERIYVDGTEFEHSVHYADDWKIPFAKLKTVAAMDVLSSYVFRHPVFAGPYRPEMAMQAVVAVMTPPAVTDEEIAADPRCQFDYGTPSDVMYDKDKALVPPSTVPALVNVTSTVEIAEAYHSDAKSELENYWKFQKGRLRGYQGRVLGPRHAKDPRRDPIAETEANQQQYAAQVENNRRLWNETPKDSLGKRSPEQVLREHNAVKGPRITDPGQIERNTARVVELSLTDNGVLHDNIRYRWNRDGIEDTLSANLRNTPFAKRLEQTAKVIVSGRVWDHTVDHIEVYDEENGTYHRLWSTDPGYTGGLSRWEHHQ